MKWLFLIIVLLNVAFLGWKSFDPKKVDYDKESIYGPPISERIHLLSEDPAVTKEDYNANIVPNDSLEKALAKAAERSELKKEDALFCPRIEFEKEAEKSKVSSVLNGLGWKVTEKDITGSRPKFWLYIPAPKTRVTAAKIVKELKAKSIDSFVINRAEMKNRISLGLFSSMERAQQAKSRIEKVSGYDSKIYEHMRNVSLQELRVTTPLSENDWKQFMLRLDISKMMIKLEKNSC